MHNYYYQFIVRFPIELNFLSEHSFSIPDMVDVVDLPSCV